MDAIEALVSEFCDDRLSEGLSPHTVRMYRSTLRYFTRYLSEKTSVTTVKQVTKRTVRGFLAYLRDNGASQNTLNVRHAGLSVFWSWLVKENEATEHVVKGVTRPRAEINETPLITAEQMSALLKLEARTPFLTARNRAVLMMLWDTGVRVGELTGIRNADIDLDAMTVRVDGKTGERTVPFGQSTRSALRKYLRARSHYPGKDSPALFLGHKGALTTNAVRIMVEDYGKRLGICGLHPHSFRHTWAHNMLAAGATVLDVQVLGGWNSPKQVLERYGIAGKRERAIAAHRRLSPGDRLGK
ncbi:tyrosine-type recombinase/integrase [Nocardiopsis dassonvillei]|uniref:tyrosine-type recombinase/integrase n=1 Tax=Nocardiopsis dassonvillei TaxID=2014 RepID=UPI00366C8B54